MAKVLIYSPNLIGKSMAGAAIRPWEFAKALSQEHQVVLISPGPVEIKSKEFEIVSLKEQACKRHFRDAHLLITQRFTLSLALMAKAHRVKVIIDAYDPSPLELLEQFKTESLKHHQEKIVSEVSNLVFSFKMAHGILCASEKQRELWLGFLLAQKLITPALYAQDASLRHFIGVVPFGLSHIPPQKKGTGFREKYGFQATDRLILWGGGIWNWFDPLSLIKAMQIIRQSRSDIKLVFMGVKPPDPHLVAMSMSTQAMQLAQELGLLNQCVFFNQEWVPYEERQNFLLEADIGVSTHFDHLETHFSFRTRLLDYLWAQLPIVATTGDSFAELIERHQLGVVVPYQDPQALAHALVSLINHPERMQQIKEHLTIVREQFYWHSVIAPLNKMIGQLSVDRHPRQRWQETTTLMSFILTKIKEKGLRSYFHKVYQHCRSSKSSS